MLRVVLDPNVLVSALISPAGVPARVIEAVLDGLSRRAARDAGWDVIVSGDADLLVFDGPPEVLTPRQLLDRFSGS